MEHPLRRPFVKLAGGISPREALRRARPHVVPILAIAAVLALAYWSTLRWLANAWTTNDYYTHGWLVPPVALFLAWRVRKALAAAPLQPNRAANLWALSLAVGLYAWAYAWRDPFLFSLSLIAALWAIPLYLLGWARAKHLLVPALFLLLAVPPPGLLYIGLELQELAVWGTTAFLALFGVAFVQDNFTITAGGLSFEVVPMCSGLSSSISILTLTTIVTVLSPLRGWAKGVLLAASVPIALVANVLRIALTILIGTTWGPEASQGFFHGASSLVVFLLALGGVLALRQLFQMRWTGGMQPV